MLYEMTKEVNALLVSKGFPYPVEYGPGAVRTNAIARTWVHVERDRGAAEQWAAPSGQHPNPPVYWKRNIAAKITIYANSTVTGARTQEHERLADKMADIVASSLYVVGKLRKLLSVGITGRFVPASELDNRSLQQWPGAIYEMTVTFSRSVPYLTWAGDKLPEGTFAANETHSEITDWIPHETLPAEDACEDHSPVPLPEGD